MVYNTALILAPLIAFYIIIRPLGFYVGFGMLPLNFPYD